MTYTYVNRFTRKIEETSSRIDANNGAYWNRCKVLIWYEGLQVGSFVPTKLDTSNLICGGFHNHELKNQ